MNQTEALLATLNAFAPSDGIERGHLASIRMLLESSPSPVSRSSFDPGHITASAFVVDPAGDRLLLHHHRRLDRWLQMGGHVDDGESVVTAALREAKEESGLDELSLVSEQPFDVDVHAIPALKGEPAHAHFDVRYLVQAGNPAAIRIAQDESNDLRWFTLDEAVEAMNSPESTRAIEKIRKAGHSL